MERGCPHPQQRANGKPRKGGGNFAACCG